MKEINVAKKAAEDKTTRDNEIAARATDLAAKREDKKTKCEDAGKDENDADCKAAMDALAPVETANKKQLQLNLEIDAKNKKEEYDRVTAELGEYRGKLD